MHAIPFQIDSCKDGARNTVPGTTDGARQYGEGLSGEEVARENRGKTGILILLLLIIIFTNNHSGLITEDDFTYSWRFVSI